MDAPTMIVLSTSKNAAALGSGGTSSAVGSTSAAAADAVPASTARACRPSRRRCGNRGTAPPWHGWIVAGRRAYGGSPPPAAAALAAGGQPGPGQPGPGQPGLGLSAGDRVAIQLGNTLDFPVVYFGALQAGLVAVPTNTGYTIPELRQLLADSGARALITSSVAAIESAAALRAELPALEHVVVAAPSGPDATTALPDLLAAAPDRG